MVTTTDSTTQQGLLTAKEMAQFVLDGYIEMEEPVPDELNAEVKNDADTQPKDASWTGLDLHAFWDRSAAVQEMEDIIWNDAAGIFLYFPVENMGLASNLNGFEARFDEFFFFSGTTLG